MTAMTEMLARQFGQDSVIGALEIAFEQAVQPGLTPCPKPRH